jgi:chromosome segregation ATPase
MACSIPDHDQLEQELNEALEDVVRLEEELADAQAQVQLVGASGSRTNMVELQTLRQEIENLSKERDRYREDFMTQKDRFTDVEAQLEDKDARLKDQEKLRRKAEDEMENVRKMLAEERLKAAEATKRLGSVEKRGRAEQRDQVMLLTEMQELRERTEDLETQLGERDALIAELSMGNQQLMELNEGLSSSNEDLRGDVADLRTKLQETAAELADTQDALIVSKEAEDDYESRLDEEQAKARRTIDVIQEELRSEQALSAKLRSEMARLKDSSAASGAGAREAELENLRQSVQSLAAELLERNDQLQQSNADIEQLKWRLEHDANGMPSEALSEANKRVGMLEKKVQEQAQSLAEEAQRYTELEDRKGALESELAEAEAWKAKYEEGHGLADAVRYQQQLKRDLQRANSELERRAQEVGQALDAREALELMVQRLKEEAGRPSDFVYPDLTVLREDHQGEVAKLKAEQREMQQQMDDLDAERLRLLKKLRQVAVVNADKGLKFAGLDADQMLKVNEFALSLRDGKVVLPLDDRSFELAQRVKALESQVHARDAQIEKLERSLLEATSIEELRAVAVGESPEAAKLQAELRAMRDENLELQRLVKGLPEQLKSSQARRRSSAGSTPAISLPVPTPVPEPAPAPASAPAAPPTDPPAPQSVSESEGGLEDVVVQLSGTVAELQVANAKLQDQLSLQTAQSQAYAQHELAAELQSLRNIVSGAVNPAAHPPSHPVQGVDPAAGASEGGAAPTSEEGQEMLRRQLRRLHLPPEEWADEVAALSGQLVVALELLNERERELDEHEELLRRYESHLVAMRGQVAALYQDHGSTVAEANKAASLAKEREAQLMEERDGLAIKVKNMSSLLSVEAAAASGDDLGAPQRALRDLSRRVMVHEVNEAVLSRRYTSMQEQLRLESAARQRAESDMVEMECSVKSRILYLEEWKAGTEDRTRRLQRQLEKSVPESDLTIAHRSLEALRNDYIELMEREVDARVQLTETVALRQEIEAVRSQLSSLEADLVREKSARSAAERSLREQQQLTEKATNDVSLALKAVQNGSLLTEFSQLVSDVTKYQSQAAQADVGRAVAEKRLELSESRVAKLTDECQKSREQAVLLDGKYRHAQKELSGVRSALVDVQDKYEGGATGEEARSLRDAVQRLEQQRESLRREAHRSKELADIASEQAQALGSVRQNREEELVDLRRQISELESRSEDDVIIGRLQRQLMATKVTYRSFVRKHEMTRANLRRKTAAFHALEARVDSRDQALVIMHEASLSKVSALKKALSLVADKGLMGSDDAETAELNVARAKEMHSRVTRMSELLKKCEADLAEAERTRTAAEFEAERSAESQRSSKKLLESLQELVDSEGGNRETGRRLIAMSEELRASKLEGLEARRRIQELIDEKRSSHARIMSLEAAVSELEAARADAETRQLLGLVSGQTEAEAQAQAEGADTVGSMLLLSPLSRSKPGTSHPNFGFTSGLSEEDRRLIREALEPVPLSELVDPEIAISRLSAANKQIVALTKALTEMKVQIQHESDRADAAERAAVSADRERSFFERQVAAHTAPLDDGSDSDDNESPNPASDGDSVAPPRRRRHPRRPGGAAAEARRQMQEAAAATVSSLKQLLREKNEALDALRRKLENVREEVRREAAVDRQEMGRLTEKIYTQNAESLEQLRAAARQLSRMPGLTGEGVSLNAKLMDQLEEVAAYLAEKEHTISQLELKLGTVTNKLATAEARCGAALQEREKMEGDMVTLAHHLQDAEERASAVAHNERMTELKKMVVSKESKLKHLRGALIRLKQEFIHAQEDAAEKIGVEELTRSRRVDGRAEALKLQVDELQQDLASLQEGLVKAKKDIERSNDARSKLQAAKDRLMEENERLGEELSRAERSAASREGELTMVRRDLDSARSSEERLRQRLKRMQKEEAKAADGDEDDDHQSRMVRDLQRRVQVLMAQNAALRGEAGDGSQAEEAGVNEETIAALRAEKHKAWEVEKKLKRRVQQLEKRLEEKMTELAAAERETAQARAAAERASRERDLLAKRSSRSSSAQIAGQHRGGEGGLEAARARIFELEEEVATLRRASEMELPSAISALQEQLRSVRQQLQETDSQRDALEKRLKSSRAGGSVIRSEEEAWQEAEALQDELKSCKARLRELEGEILERDSSAMSLRFDVEAARSDSERLRRRLKELDQAQPGHSDAPAGSRGGGSFKREKDLESLVAALKKVVEKLQGENERLRRAAADAPKLTEANRKLKTAKARIQELQEEVASLRGKAQAGEDTISRLARKQEIVNQLRRQLKAREGEIEELQALVRRAGDERDQLRVEMANHQAAGASSGDASQETRSQLRKVEAHNRALQDQLAEAERERVRLERRGSSASGSASAQDALRMRELMKEASALKEENQRLRKELEPFDLAFFEEIEDLKFKYSEALHKIKAYETSA